MKEHIYEAEAAVLGSIIEEPDLIHECTLQKLDFEDDRHQLIMEYFRFLEENDKRIDLNTMSQVSGKNIEKIGGYTYLIRLVKSVVSIAQFDYYQSIVREESLLRQAVNTLGHLTNAGASGGMVGKELIGAAQAAVDELSEKLGASGEGQGTVKMSDVLKGHQDVIRERRIKKGITGAKTASKEMDALTGGHQDEDLIIIGARPSIGKTALVVEDSKQSGRSGYTVLFLSLEMKADKIAERYICNIGNIDSTKLRTGNLGDQDWERWSYAMDELEKLPIYIDDTPGMTIQDIKRKVKQAKKKYPKLIVYVDYLQLIDPGRKFNKNDEGVAFVSKSLKRIARQEKCPIVAISAVGRGVEQRQDKRPMMSDLRESGSIESDADIIIFLYRDDYYNAQSDRKGVMELILAKGRNVGIGTVDMGFNPKTGGFADLDRTQFGGAKPNGGTSNNGGRSGNSPKSNRRRSNQDEGPDD
jgi:replicative DNA helicase